MRNSQAKKDENRRLILDAAGHLFRERGIDSVTVADVMKAASMTHGGFYRHFADKNELVTQALADVLGNREEPATIGAFADAYLSMEHRAAVGDGCTFAALGPEVARGADEPRRVMSDTVRRRIDNFARTLPGAETERRQVAIGSWATMIGAILLARMAEDPVLAGEILDAARAWIDAGQPAGQNAGDNPMQLQPAGPTSP
jgi:TetR/AcrR family transcriptional repressor of nem operon